MCPGLIFNFRVWFKVPNLMLFMSNNRDFGTFATRHTMRRAVDRRQEVRVADDGLCLLLCLL